MLIFILIQLSEMHRAGRVRSSTLNLELLAVEFLDELMVLANNENM